MDHLIFCFLLLKDAYLSKLVRKLSLHLEAGGEDTQGDNMIEMPYS